jgi:hypothetical protein
VYRWTKNRTFEKWRLVNLWIDRNVLKEGAAYIIDGKDYIEDGSNIFLRNFGTFLPD